MKKLEKNIKNTNSEEKEKDEDETSNENIALLSSLKKNDVLNIKGYNIKTGETKPPKRYNSGTMILAMENAGKLIITDGVFSMGGDIANLPAIIDLAKKYGARVMVDDAHGLGVLGNGGRGTADYSGLTDEVDVIMGTFSKSLASLGGYMAAKDYVVDYVKHNARPYIFSASITPASCATALAALRHLKAHPELVTKLADISHYVREGMLKRNIKIKMSSTPIVPIYTNDAHTTLKIGKTLYDEGVYVNPVLPPATSPTECLLRTSYMASHTYDILDEAMDIIKDVLNRYGI